MREYLISLSAVLLGSALGGSARYWVTGWIGRWLGPRFPWGTLAVNVSGALVVGILAAFFTLTVPFTGSAQAEWLLIAGVCGSYTTVSSFALQTLDLARESRWQAVIGNIVASFGLCLLGSWLGVRLGAVGIAWITGGAA